MKNFWLDVGVIAWIAAFESLLITIPLYYIWIIVLVSFGFDAVHPVGLWLTIFIVDFILSMMDYKEADSE